MIAVSLESIACPVCGEAGGAHVMDGTDRLHGMPGVFRIVRCTDCGLMRTDPRPDPASMGAFYPDSYGPFAGSRVVPPQTPPPPWRRRVRRLLEHVFRYGVSPVPPMPPGRMLEIGCASGSFMHRMREQGWRVSGVEFSETAASAARAAGLDVVTGSLESIDLDPGTYDLIVGWMVLEHLHEPVEGLRKLREGCRPGGMLALSVPNANSLDFRVFRERWYPLQLPTHLFHFTTESLTRTLECAGWKVERIFHQRILTDWIVSAGYLLADLGAPRIAAPLLRFPSRPGRWHQILYPLAWLLSAFGLTGRMTVWARRLP